MIAAKADRESREARDELRRDLSRYRADYLAARAPLPATLAAGALAGIGVYLVPLAAVLASFLLLRLSYLVVAPPVQLAMRLFGWGAYRVGRVVPAPGSSPAPVEGGGLEARLDPGGTSWVAAVLLIIFWPCAMAAIGALASALYRARRARRFDDLVRSPVEFPIAPEWLLFYVLTAAAGLFAGIGTLVALGTNLIFAWAGYLIWRWLCDRILSHLAPAAATEALAAAERERVYRRRLRESG